MGKAQLDECEKHRDGDGIRWELWNIEDLSTSREGPVIISRFDAIPFNAVRATEVAVDLTKCKLVSDWHVR